MGVKIGVPAPKFTKAIAEGNPLIANVFCADPTAVEYEGRLYVYGTNDHQQYEAVGAEGRNTYEHIKSIVMLSTEDMVNWTFHGIINVGEISPWAIASWAPSITSRVEADGLTHFYLFYSNSGCGTGVLTATSPTGPWSDPLGHCIVDETTEGLDGCKNPFDPGVVIDGEGRGWLAFGGGDNGGRIIRLGEDMISIDSAITKVPSLYHYEANELNYINGTYVYTYNNNWEERTGWSVEGYEPPTRCSMAYLVSKTPLDIASWEYRGQYFENPGDMGLVDSNNHTHLHKYAGKYYLFYHSLFPQAGLGTNGGFRSLCVNEIEVDEQAVRISPAKATKQGVSRIKPLDAFKANSAATMFTSSGIVYELGERVTVCAAGESGIIMVKGAAADGAVKLIVRAGGKGKLELHLDEPEAAAEINIDGEREYVCELSEKISGESDIYFTLSGGVSFEEWRFDK